MKYIELASVSILLGFIFSYIIGKILVPIFRKIKASQIINEYLIRHSTKKNTPTMGGLIFTFSTLSILFILLLMKKIMMSSNLLIVIFIFSFYAVIGFIDDYLIIKRKTNKGLTENQKLFLQTIAAVIFFYLFLITGNEPLLWIHTLNLRVDIGFFYGIFILLVLLAGSNAVNLTDSLDGLAGGLSLIAFFTFGIISFETNWLLGYEEIGVFCFILVGSLIGFLVFNLNPAKIFILIFKVMNH